MSYENRDFTPEDREENINRDYNVTRTQRPGGDYGTSPRSEYERRDDEQPKKKKKVWPKVLAACLAVVVICGAVGVGGVAAWKGLRKMSPEASEGETVTEEKNPEKTTEKESKKESSPGLKTFAAESESMTPGEIYAEYVDCVVAIRTESTAVNIFGQLSRRASAGTGFIITEDGYILTNNHVVENASSVTVTLDDGSEYVAAVMGADENSDVAVLKIEADGLKAVNIGDSDGIIVGESVAVIGNPLGELTNSLTCGVVSALDRLISTEANTEINMFQIDAAVNAGNSGGPVFDSEGRVIGVVTAKYANGAIEGLGFAIPINDAVEVAEKLIENGYVPTGVPAFNIVVRTLDATTAAYYDVPVGAYITEISAGGCCDKAGIQVGDIITKVGDSKIETKEDLSTAKAGLAPGDTVTVTVYRSGEYISVKVTMDEQGAPLEAQETFDPFGSFIN